MPLNKLDHLLGTIALGLVSLYLCLSVFSIAAQSVLLGGIAFFLLILIVIKKFEANNIPGNDFVWLSIPTAYLLSLFYSTDFHRGWNQWLNLTPVIVLLMIFYLFKDRLKSINLWRGYLMAVLISVIILIVQNFQVPFSNSSFYVFHTRDNLSWIYWSGAIISILSIETKWLRTLLFFCFLMALVWLGDVTKLFFVLFFYIGFEKIVKYISVREIMVDLVLVLPCLFVLGFSLAPGFKENSFQVFKLFNEAKQELLYSCNQWLKHLINGVGSGDYIHAMWNEYNEHQLQVPDKAKLQFFHFLVSTGLLAFFTFYIITRKYLNESKAISFVSIYCLIILFFFAPFTSQVSASAFILPVLFARLKY